MFEIRNLLSNGSEGSLGTAVLAYKCNGVEIVIQTGNYGVSVYADGVEVCLVDTFYVPEGGKVKLHVYDVDQQEPFVVHDIPTSEEVEKHWNDTSWNVPYKPGEIE